MEKNNTIINFPIKKLSLESNYTSFNYKLIEFSLIDTKNKHYKYNLTSNVIHDGKYETGNFRVQVLHKQMEDWFDVQDLHINQILPELVVLSESYIQFYEGYEEKTNEEK